MFVPWPALIYLLSGAKTREIVDTCRNKSGPFPLDKWGHDTDKFLTNESKI